jgi:phosphoesterase RecJ-like protein
VPARDLIIQIDKKKNAVEKISYNDENELLNIVISPKGKLLEAKDLKIIPGNYHFDLIFVLDTPDVEKIDKIYDKFTELFFEVPIVNIDHHSGNEYFGTVNLVDLTATSTAEILVSIIEALGPNNFSQDVATCLLTGLIADTASFKNTSTTPKALTISAQMLAAGARQQEIIQNLYKTRPITTLKLWGKVLSNIEYDRENRLVVSSVTAADMREANAQMDDINGVLDELLASAPGTDIVLVLVEEKGQLGGVMKGLNGQEVLGIAEKFGGRGKALNASFKLPNTDIAKSKKRVIDEVISYRQGAVEKAEVSNIVVENDIDKKNAGNKEHQPSNIQNTEPRDITVEVRLEADSIEDIGELLSIEKALEGETEVIEEAINIEEIFGAENARVEKATQTKSSEEDPINQALQSIDNEIETGGKAENQTPNIDVEEVKDKKESLRKLGEVMRGYTPGKSLDNSKKAADGKQPIDPNIWK